MNELTPQYIFEEQVPKRLRENPKLRDSLTTIVLFDISGPNGGKWLLDCKKESDWILTDVENAQPGTTVTISDEDFIALVSKKLNPQGAMMAGRLKLKPLNMNVAKKLGKLLS